ncbi:hypothetical protein AWC38_SpisGene21186 [Stylophora pistillata]|uniref:Uncharacterized protein n=1 Tax=Stylophora pistillata TaxID=50429 RepID=A0A2B4R8G5_STYPI|nr:hypothetical protein AWC38_SpisGene21186 [Stylophora pistillata]
MDANRFAKFRHSLLLVYGFLKHHDDENRQVEKVFTWLSQEFPELKEASLNAEEAEDFATKFQAFQSPRVEKTRVEKKSKEEVKKILAASVQNTDALTDYSNVDTVVNTEQDCLNKLDVLSKALTDAKKRLIYFSALQGEVLQKLKDISKCTISELGMKTGALVPQVVVITMQNTREEYRYQLRKLKEELRLKEWVLQRNMLPAANGTFPRSLNIMTILQFKLEERSNQFTDACKATKRMVLQESIAELKEVEKRRYQDLKEERKQSKVVRELKSISSAFNKTRHSPELRRVLCYKKNMAFQVGKTKALQAEELLLMVDIITDLNEDSVDEALVLRTFEVDRDFTRRSIVQGGDVQEENEKSHMNTQYQ